MRLGTFMVCSMYDVCMRVRISVYLPKCGRATGEVFNDGQVLTIVGTVWRTFVSNMHAYHYLAPRLIHLLLIFFFFLTFDFLLLRKFLFSFWFGRLWMVRLSFSFSLSYLLTCTIFTCIARACHTVIKFSDRSLSREFSAQKITILMHLIRI